MIVKILSSATTIPGKKDTFYFLHGKCLSQYEDKDIKTIFTHTNLLTRASDTSSSGIIALVDIDKTAILLDPLTGKITKTCNIEKGAMCATFYQETLYIGDKFGDITQCTLSETTADSSNLPKAEIVAGCVSMVTDLLVDEHRLIMADRDEKIRLINRKYPFIIERFLLAHTEYVGAIARLTDSIIVSIGGDGLLLVWDINNKSDEPINKLDLGHLSAPSPFDPIAMVITDNNLISFILDGKSLIYQVRYEKEDLTLLEPITLVASKLTALSPLDDGSDSLVVAGVKKDKQEPFLAIIGKNSEILVEKTIGNADNEELDEKNGKGNKVNAPISSAIIDGNRANMRKRRYEFRESEL